MVGGLAGARVLVVEDETIVSLLLEDMLVDLGCEVLGPAASVAKALRLIRTDALGAIDTAILDVNVAGEEVYPVAEALAERHVPFAFTTGYGKDGVHERWRASSWCRSRTGANRSSEYWSLRSGGSPMILESLKIVDMPTWQPHSRRRGRKKWARH